MAAIDPYSSRDPLPPTLREGDHFLLHTADDRQIFAQAVRSKAAKKGNAPACKINKRTYSTHNLIGLPYGTVLEVGREGLVPLPEGEDLLPCSDGVMGVIKGMTTTTTRGDGKETEDGVGKDANNDETAPSKNDDATKNANGSGKGTTATDKNSAITPNDNRDLVDDNTSQKLTFQCVKNLVEGATSGSHIVAALVSNSATFGSKTAFSQAKYVKRKQMKYQLRCRIVRVTPATLCSAMHRKDARRICNLREDTLGRMLSDANVCAGERVLVFDDAVQGIVTASCTRRMGGYGSVYSLFAGQQPSYLDWVVNRMNFTLGERQSLKWVSMGEVFGDYDAKEMQMRSLYDETTGEWNDVERVERERIQWPAPLQPHTRNYLLNEVKDDRKIDEFLAKRNARFTRKLTRHSMLELRGMIDRCRDREENLDGAGSNNAKGAATTALSTTAEKDEKEEMDTKAPASENAKAKNDEIQQCDSLIIATKYDPTATILRLFPYLAPSCPFVIFHEFLEPLLDTFNTLQNYHALNANDEDNTFNDADAENVDNTAPCTSSSTGKNTNSDKPRTPMMQRKNIAINLRLTDSWFRDYQVLEGRTHPDMSMSQNGGYVLTGTKLCPRTGTNELNEDDLREIRARVGGRRKQAKGNQRGGGGGGGKRKNENGGNKGPERRKKTKRNGKGDGKK
eukprot:CAMPEP_0181131344 /NCGR_PEP_ID=MMETSP1071-20121207/30374_1 /TAXON_ID=35127 /ORGANISM="Thalassiosira sp., Strain NH16" /LENGTH=679 /DNA_ID=CAMNT_0023217529 /DNA_START=39 /DNA_END=2078 /DNA_ORIENTATION=-